MKIEIGESLACSYLRHVKRCWLVQANWKASEHWKRELSDAALNELFQEMKRRFDRDGGVFKRTKDAAQFLKQAEIDVVGVELQGGVHAMEVAFHEAGLSYGDTKATDNRVLKKMLRTLLVLRAYHPPSTPLHISFLSPEVKPGVLEPLKKTFDDLRKEHPEVEWHLIANDDFTESVVEPTLKNASDIADSSELFVRSAKLLELTGRTRRNVTRNSGAFQASIRKVREGRPEPFTPIGDEAFQASNRKVREGRDGETEKIQPLVRELMRTLLDGYPTLLSEKEKHELQDNEYCKRELGLKIGNHGLIRRIEEGAEIKGRRRYWKDPYGDFYVCSQWWLDDHHANAEALLAFVAKLARRSPQYAAELDAHVAAFLEYVERNAG